MCGCPETFKIVNVNGFSGHLIYAMGFPHGSDSKESACNVGYPGSIPGLGRSPGEGNGNPLQNSCLENTTDRGAWQATVHAWSYKESDMTKQPHFPFLSSEVQETNDDYIT